MTEDNLLVCCLISGDDDLFLQVHRLSDLLFSIGRAEELFSSKCSFSECFTCRNARNAGFGSSLVSLFGLLYSDSPPPDLIPSDAW